MPDWQPATAAAEEDSGAVVVVFMAVVLVVAVVDTPEAEVEVQGLAVPTSLVEQDSVLVDPDSVVVR